MAEISLAKRQKTVRQRGEIRTGRNQEKGFQGEQVERAGVHFQDSGGRKEKKGFQERENPSLNVFCPRKAVQAQEEPERSNLTFSPTEPLRAPPEARERARRGVLAA